jgi:hypothetical protein
MDKAYAFMLVVFGVAVAMGVAFPKSRFAVFVPLLLPIGAMTIPLVSDPKPADAFLFVAPFLIVIAVLYGGISYGGVTIGRRLRYMAQRKQRSAKQSGER